MVRLNKEKYMRDYFTLNLFIRYLLLYFIS